MDADRNSPLERCLECVEGGDQGGVTTIRYYYFNGQRVPENRGSVWTWVHSDHLHSATIITAPDGTVVRRLAYSVFGKEVQNVGNWDAPKYTYTGKEHDVTGLYYYGARYYDPCWRDSSLRIRSTTPARKA